uniref:HMA domain-containing protein n=1 Tax=Ananas comosus var. bracteatus TaxID=296719 RepID=A0A6V7QAF5_ANACO|nr:unnamed protein product [Ananas comosus var. bracteatus]
MKKIVLKVDIVCGKCRTRILATVAKLCGRVKSMELDEEKCTLTVVGDVDPVLIVNALRKSKKCAVIESVGPDKEPEKAPEKPKPTCRHTMSPKATCRHKIVLKVSIVCSKCKTTILQAVAKLDGAKEGEKGADVVSVGDNKDKKKEEEKCKELALCCAACRTMGFGSFRSFPSKLVYVEEPSSGCTII